MFTTNNYKNGANSLNFAEKYNHLEKLFNKFPKGKWDYWALSGNPNTTLKMVQKTLNRDWSWLNMVRGGDVRKEIQEILTWDRIYQLYLAGKIKDSYFFRNISSSPIVTWEVVQSLPDKDWNWEMLSLNPNMTLEIVQANSGYSWSMKHFSANRNLTWDIVKNSAYFPWDKSMLSSNPNITWKIVQENPDYGWDWSALSGNKNITWEIVSTNLDRAWDWNALSHNENFIHSITPDIVREYANKPWSWIVLLQCYQKVPWDLVQSKPEIVEDWDAMAQNNIVTWKVVQDFPHPNPNGDDEWDSWGLSLNGNMTWENVRDNPEFVWSSTGLCCNPNITPDILESNPDLFQDADWKSYNPNMTYRYFRTLIENGEASFGKLSQNRLLHGDERANSRGKVALENLFRNKRKLRNYIRDYSD